MHICLASVKKLYLKSVRRFCSRTFTWFAVQCVLFDNRWDLMIDRLSRDDWKRQTVRTCHKAPLTVMSAIAIFMMASFNLVAQTIAPNTTASQNIAQNAKVIGDDSRIRFLVEFDQEPDINFFYLTDPYRLVIELPKTQFLFDKAGLKPRGLLKNIRYGGNSSEQSRIILSMQAPAIIEGKQIQILENDVHRLVLDISVTSEALIQEVISEQSWDGAQAAQKTSRINLAGQTNRDQFVLVLDAGHGGIDGGAEGQNGAIEKDITLAFVEKLQNALTPYDDIKIILTRDRDQFLSLGARVQIARREHADLFISVHADSIRQKTLRGASVYTLSDQASDELTASLAESENLTDVIAGIDSDNTPDIVADILVDMARRETEIFSHQVADQIVADFNGQVRLINNPHRRAGFRVLTAPDVPSVLIELGFLSNINDEKLLTDEIWRRNTAALMAQSIIDYKTQIMSARN